jgi:predicted chitinase
MATRTAKKTTQHRWKIYRLRGSPAVFIGAVVATDEKAAINAAIEEFGIDNPAQQKRLLAQRD